MIVDVEIRVDDLRRKLGIVDPIEESVDTLVTKLESLEDDARLDKSAIKGLDEEFASIRALPRGGGGTSQIGVQAAIAKLFKNQSFSTSSATTTSTLSNKVLNNIWMFLRYNGQMLQYGTHYTVSGTTITYLFTLDDSSTVEASYVVA